ncbi:MAG: hypothetical protein FWH48_00770, partial [Oscillospiraceae bacterium]|nr:hypothetical protein [Oscillospiraceae bacterium]
DYDVDLYPLPFFGLICQYAIQDGRLCAYLPIQVGMTEFCGRIEILYRFDFNCFEFDSIKALGE